MLTTLDSLAPILATAGVLVVVLVGLIYMSVGSRPDKGLLVTLGLVVTLLLRPVYKAVPVTPITPLNLNPNVVFWVLLVAFYGGLIWALVKFRPSKAIALAQAAYREAVRQPLFWFLTVFSMGFMFISVFIPYFTLGEDLKMMKDLQLDAILVPTLILAIFTAGMSIAEEIEGRTAVTLLSKPISRRQFLLGKFTGIMLAALLMATLLTVFMGWTITFKIGYESLEDPAGLPEDISAIRASVQGIPGMMKEVVERTLTLFAAIRAMAPGPVLIVCQVMILTSIAVALATRLPLVVNLVVCLGVFFFGRLTPVLEAQAGDNVLVGFIAQVFGTLLPALNYYDVGPTLASGLVEVPWTGYVLQAVFHAVVYTGIALLFGLVLFEDRDVA